MVQNFDGFARSERVALFMAPGRETVQGSRGGLQKCAHDVCFPKARVGSEKFAENI